MLVRSTFGRGRCQSIALSLLLSRRDAFRRLFIVQPGFRRWTSPHRHATHDQLETRFVLGDVQPVVDVQDARGFHPISIHMHEPARYRVGGLRSALEQAGEP